MFSIANSKWSALSMSTLAFTLNFAVWTMFAILGIGIKAEIGLSETQFGLLVATPMLSGAFARLPMGLLAERFGGRLVFTMQLLFVAAPTYGLAFASDYWHYLVFGLFVGIAGASFSVGVTYISAWFDANEQGLAMGIFGAGNVGVAISNLLIPFIMFSYGWREVPQYYAAALVVMAVLFWVFTATDPRHLKRQESGEHPSFEEHMRPVLELRVWRMGFYYFFVFGGFVSLALWLPQYFVNEYGLTLQNASYATLAFTLPAAFVRVLGGWFADNIGARNVNWWVFWICMVCLFFLSYPQTTMTIHGIDREVNLNIGINVYLFTAIIFIMGVAMGFGKASIFKLVHDYYPNNMGAVGGMVGSIGAMGGFVLPILFGIAADLTSIRSSCFMLLYGVLGLCMIWMYYAIKLDEHLERVREANSSDFLLR